MGKKAILGFGILLSVVVGNGILTAKLGGLSYSRFTWEAYAQIVYNPSPTPTFTPTPTATATFTPTSTPTPTPSASPSPTPTPTPSPSPTPTPTVGFPDGDPCTTAAQCSSQHCTDGLCCNIACQGPSQRCNVPSDPGRCQTLPAAVPTVTLPYAAILALVLLAIGAVSVGRL